MSKAKRYDLIILGAGIAGLSVAAAARKAGLKTVVIDRAKPGSGASGAWMGLLNPATGRRAKKAWQAETALQATLELFEEVQNDTGETFYWNNGVIRP
ncbi:MAG: FAD-dependent oxidoreductase, partial [Balneolaceae bacterium]